MKRSGISMVAWLGVAFGLLAACGTPAARADFTFGEPVRVGSSIPGISGADDIGFGHPLSSE